MSGAALLTAYGKWMSKSSYVTGNHLGKRLNVDFPERRELSLRGKQMSH